MKRTAGPFAFLCCVSLIILLSSFAVGQIVDDGNETGFPSYVGFHGSDFDSVALNNGNLHLDIPLFSVKQRGGRTTSWHFVYDTPTWTLTYYPRTQFDQAYWVVNPANADGSANGRIVQSDTGYALNWRDSTISCPYTTQSGTTYMDVAVRSDFAVLDPDGTKHPILLRTEEQPPSGGHYAAPCEGQQLTGIADDGSGYKADITASVYSPKVWANDGTQILPTWTDSNGNYAETMGRPAPVITYDPNGKYQIWTFTNSNGNSAAFRIDYAFPGAVTQACQFAATVDPCYEITDGGSAGGFFPSKITLPNGQAYQFTFAVNAMQDLQSIQLPTGGTLSYIYETHEFSNHYNWRDGVPYNVRRSVISRTINSDGHTYYWTYSGYRNGQPTTNVTTVIDPLGNEEDHTYSVIGAAADVTAETQVVKKWLDPSTGTLKTLQTIAKNYASEMSPDTAVSINLRETCELVTFQNGTTRRTETDYETFPSTFLLNTYTAMRLNTIERREYDFGTSCGSTAQPLRRTHYNYLHLQNAVYANANIVNRITDKSTYDQAGLRAETTTTYDSSGVSNTNSGTCQNPAGATGHDYCNFPYTNNVRGNPTLISRWLNTSGSWLATTNSYDDLGNLLTSLDPGHHSTIFSYTDSWVNTACIPSGVQTHAYVTQVQMRSAIILRHSTIRAQE